MGTLGKEIGSLARTETFLSLGIQVLSLIDLVFTLVHVYTGGSEANPFLQWALKGGPVSLATVKMGITTLGLTILLRAIRFNENVRSVLWMLFSLYLGVIAYHLNLLPVVF